MCVIDLEPCELWREQPRRARKPHVCDCCEGAIDPGEVYIDHFSMFDGDVTSEKMCALCLLAAEDFRQEHRTRSNPSGMPELLSECVAEGATKYNVEIDEYELDASSLKWKRYLDEMRERCAARRAA